MIAESIPQVQALSADDKFTLAAELWRDVTRESGATVDPAIVAELTERSQACTDQPDECESWELVRDRIRPKGRR